ncbi:MAG: molybdopterin-synthase adenylyltransferase MoeB [Bacteroidetes bacterium]|nr:molybdopterin-synthase adenylyltransferase MoeB [Bacteroidota bacterium]
MLSKQEISRYSRHLLLPEIGMIGQEKLKNSRVLVIGAGGLGCPVLLYLTAAGVGNIGIIDFDLIDETNLHRQILFDSSDIGKPKAEVAKAKLQKQNPLVDIVVLNTKLSTQNALEIFSTYDIIVDGTDNFATRYLVNDACFILKKILVSGSIFRFEGQVAVFDFRKDNVPTYRCLFPSPPSPDLAPSCSEAGVIGVLPGIIGTLMANETIKVITGIGEILSGKLLVMNVLNMNFQTLEFERDSEAINTIPKTEIEFKKMDYEYFCGRRKQDSSVHNISVDELMELILSKEKIQIVDVREINESPIITLLNDLKIPLGEIEERAHEISRDRKVIVICQSGIRSAQAIEILQNQFAFKNLFNLKGGVMEWVMNVNKTEKV